MIPSVTEEAALVALCAFLQSVLPDGVTVARGQVNRVSSPEGDYVEVWSLNRQRLSTSGDTPVDSKFTAAIAGTAMTVSAMLAGAPIAPGNQLFGAGLANPTAVQSQTSGTPGGAGVYVVAPSQTIAAETMSAGTMLSLQPTELILQVDVHGPASADNAQVILTVLRSDFAVDQLSGTLLTPLYADDPRQTAFITAASQFEDRWSIDAHFEIDPTVSIPQQFADSVALTVTNIDATFPP